MSRNVCIVISLAVLSTQIGSNTASFEPWYHAVKKQEYAGTQLYPPTTQLFTYFYVSSQERTPSPKRGMVGTPQIRVYVALSPDMYKTIQARLQQSIRAGNDLNQLLETLQADPSKKAQVIIRVLNDFKNYKYITDLKGIQSALMLEKDLLFNRFEVLQKEELKIR